METGADDMASGPRDGGPAGGGLAYYLRGSLKFLLYINWNVFAASLNAYIVLIVLDKLKYGFASFFFNMNILLAVVVVTGCVAVLTSSLTRDRGTATTPALSWNKVCIAVVFLGVAGAIMIYFGSATTGATLIVSLVVGGVLIYVLALLLILDQALS
ncbi:MAG: hypothetical protein SWK76_04985 [Actinomycetota bacterium]|nr:hypothetical protein [Actinomycetota bacterium]